MNERMMNLLYRSFDEKLPPGEEEILSQALVSDEALRAEKARIEEMRGLLRDKTVRSFDPFFPARVMRRIEDMQGAGGNFMESMLWSFKLVAMAAMFLIAILVSQSLTGQSQFSLDSVLGLPQPSLEETWSLDFQVQENTP